MPKIDKPTLALLRGMLAKLLSPEEVSMFMKRFSVFGYTENSLAFFKIYYAFKYPAKPPQKTVAFVEGMLIDLLGELYRQGLLAHPGEQKKFLQAARDAGLYSGRRKPSKPKQRKQRQRKSVPLPAIPEEVGPPSL